MFLLIVMEKSQIIDQAGEGKNGRQVPQVALGPAGDAWEAEWADSGSEAHGGGEGRANEGKPLKRWIGGECRGPRS